MKSNSRLKKILTAGLATSILAVNILNPTVYAESLNEMNSKLNEMNSNVNNINSKVNDLNSKVNGVDGVIQGVNEEINNYQTQIDSKKNEIDGKESELNELLGEKMTVEDEINLINSQIYERVIKINKLNEDIEALEAKIKLNEEKIEKIQKDIEANTELLKERLIVMYKKGDIQKIEILLSSNDVNDFLSRNLLMKTVAKYDKDLIESLKSDKAKIEKLKLELNGQKTSLEINKSNEEDEKAQLDQNKKKQDELLLELQRQEDLTNAQVEELKQATLDFEQTLSARQMDMAGLEDEKNQYLSNLSDYERQLAEEKSSIASQQRKISQKKQAIEEAKRQEELRRQEELKKQEAENNKKPSPNTGGGGQETPRPAPSSGRMLWPTASGYISSPYGWRASPFGNGREFHLGIDIASGQGTEIYAAESGVVVKASWSSLGYGNLVIIDHGNGKSTYYAHLNSFNVSEGQAVGKGDLVAFMGTTGNSTGPHLHFEVRQHGVTTNPLGHL